ncbi:hypothetical protein D3C76_1635180 [compost metagenome]
MMMLGTKFEMLLSRDDDDTLEMLNLDNELVLQIGVIAYSDDLGPVFDKLNKFKSLIRAELESAWSDIQRDLGKDNKSFWWSLFQ